MIYLSKEFIIIYISYLRINLYIILTDLIILKNTCKCMSQKNGCNKSSAGRRSFIKGTVGVGASALGTGIVSADSEGKKDLSAAFDTMIDRHGTPREKGVAVVKDGQAVYADGDPPSSPPRSVRSPSIGTGYVFGDGFETEYWCDLKPTGNSWKASLNGDNYQLTFTKADQSELSKKMEANESSATSQDATTSSTTQDVTTSSIADIDLTKGIDTTFYPGTLSDGDTYSNVFLIGGTSDDYNLSKQEGYADAKVFAGGQSTSEAEIWMTVSTDEPGGVECAIGGTWSGSMVATPGTSSKGEVSVFIREEGSGQDIDSGNILSHTAPVYGDYWQNMSSYEDWSGDGGNDNTVFASLDSYTTYEVGVRLRCTSSALDISGSLPGSVRSDFYRKNEPLDPTQNRKFASLDSIEFMWPNI